MLTNLLLFAGVSLVVIVTPGPDTALTVRNSVYGRRSGILTTVGVGTGQLAWALLTACGVASVLAAHQGALTVLRLAGAAYLVGLGAHALWASWHSPSTTLPRGRGMARDGRSLRGWSATWPTRRWPSSSSASSPSSPVLTRRCRPWQDWGCSSR